MKKFFEILNLGRFLTKDPLGMIDGPNLYAYVTNDPINYIDPMGTQSAKDCPLAQYNLDSSSTSVKNLEEYQDFLNGEINALNGWIDEYYKEIHDLENKLTPHLERLKEMRNEADEILAELVSMEGSLSDRYKVVLKNYKLNPSNILKIALSGTTSREVKLFTKLQNQEKKIKEYRDMYNVGELQQRIRVLKNSPELKKYEKWLREYEEKQKQIIIDRMRCGG